MNVTRSRTPFTSRAASLLGTTSLLALFSASAFAQGAAPPATPVEEVLITGSLIRGAEAVGVPVTALGQEEFRQTGALTVSDVLRSVPSIQVEASTSIANAGGQINRSIGVDIHTLNSNTSPRTLMLINGMRFPAAGHGTDRFDPSIIPQLAVERVDVLADGASATYGSDAVAGVLNVIMRRRYEGAMTQLRYGAATDGGAGRALFSQLYGTAWDSGDVTVSYEWYDEKAVPGAARGRQFAFDYTPWGLDNRHVVSYAVPPVYSIGTPNGGALISACTNCFSLPSGVGWNYGDTPGHTNPLGAGSVPTVNWTGILANPGAARNQIDPYVFSDVLASQQRNAATITFDQEIFTGVELFADAFYSNRRVQQRWPVLANPARNQSNLRAITVPTTNPYYPAGAPSGVRVSYNISAELQPKNTASEVASRWSAGFNLDLPFDWGGRLYFAFNEEKNIALVDDIANLNNVSAALGNTVVSLAATGTRPGQAAFTKPANIPFLNLFCDPFAYQCNSQATLDYISGFRDYHQHYQITEWGMTFDGPLFELPGGEVSAAVGFNKYAHTYAFYLTQNYNANSTALLDRNFEPAEQENWAVYGQLNVPIIGDMNALPFLQRVELELSLRHDRYATFGGTTNPKIGMNVIPMDGLTLRGAWGTSFRAPAFSDASGLAGVQIQGINASTGDSNNVPACLAGETTPVAGSAAASLGATCAAIAALPGSVTANGVVFPGGIVVRGGAGGAVAIRGGTVLGPEEAENYSFGFQYRPTMNFLTGLNIDVTYFHVKVDGLIQGIDPSPATLRDPNVAFTVITRADPNLAGYVGTLIRDPRTQVNTSFEPNIHFLVDSAVRNTGYVMTDGIDFSVGYDWDAGNFGTVSPGIDGTYFLHRRTLNIQGADPVEAYEGESSACLYCAPPIPPRFRYRGRLGWTSADQAWNINLFANYTAHHFHSQVTPPNAPPGYSNIVPAHVTVDFSLGYNTGTDAVNDYLDNLDIRFVVNNVMNKYPPFMYKISTGGSNPAAFDISQSPVGRQATVVLTKTW